MKLFVRALALLSLATLCAAGWQLLNGSNAPLAKTEAKEKPAGGPAKAFAWRRLAWLDENGKVAKGVLARAIQQREALVKPATRVSGDSWFQRGPDDVAGRTRALVIHPTDPLIMWMGTAGGGVWKTTDGGSNWVAKSDQLSSLAVATLAMSPTDPNVLFAGTGEGYFNSDAIQGAGLYKSTDAGETWTLIPNTAQLANINKIAISPTDANLMLMTATDNITFTNGGIYRSTNGGSTWTKVHAAHGAHSVQFIPLNTTRLVASTVNYNTGTVTALVSIDSGATWTNSVGLAGVGGDRVELRPAPNNANIVYGSKDGSIYKSTNGGSNYSLVGSISSNGPNWYCNDLWVDPTDATRVVAAGTYTFRSVDSGASWTRITNGYIQTDQPHPDDHFLLSPPGYNGTTNKTLFVCTDGGVYRTGDITAASVNGGWVRLDKTAKTTQFYGIAGDGPTGKIIGGTQDNGTLRLGTSNDHATMDLGGDGGWCAMDPTDTTYSYNEYIYLQIHRNTGGSGPNGSTPIYNGLSDAFNSQANFIAPFIMDPNNPQTLLAGGWSLWRCTNARATTPQFTAIKSGGSDYISAIAVAKGNSDIIYVAQNDGKLYKTTNGTAVSPSWTAIDDNSAANPLPNRYITRILVDPSDANKVYVCLGGFTSQNLWRSTNGGANWSVRTGTGAGILPQVPIRSIVRHPNDADMLHVGTEVGVFSSADGGVTWSTTNDAPANVSVDELAYLNNSTTLVAATHGRGIWQLKRVLLDAIQFSQNPQYGGNDVTGTVTLKAVAPAGGMTIGLSSSDAAASVPASVFIPEGSISANFTITTTPVATQKTATITGSVSSVSVTADLSILPAVLAGVSLNPNEVSATSVSQGTVSLTGPAPAGGSVVTLKSSQTAVASVPASVTIPAGATSANFNMTSKYVGVESTSTVTATMDNVAFTDTLTVKPVTLTKLVISPSTVVGGTRPTATITLLAAPVTNVTINAVTSNNGIALTAAVTVPAGSLTGTGQVITKPVTVDSSVSLTATLGPVTKTANVNVKAPTILSLARSAGTIVGGSPVLLKATVTLNGPAPAGGKVVSLSSDNAAVSVPAQVTVPATQTTVVATLQTFKVDVPTTVTVSATTGLVTKTFTVSIIPYLKSVTVSPTSVYGGVKSTGTVYLVVGAPAGGMVVPLSSSSGAASIPASVTIAAGLKTATFQINTTPVAVDTVAVLTAGTGASAKSVNLTIKRPALSLAKVSPISVVGGSTTLVQFTVTLSSAAPVGGLTVTLSSNNAAASVPASVVVPQGSKTALVSVTHNSVANTTSVTLTASLNGVNKTSVLTINP